MCSDTKARRKFKALVLDELLPTFCDYYSYDPAGFHSATLDRISEHDAMWLLQALSTGSVTQDQAFFQSALSGAKEQIFWQGTKSVSPRPITVWVEPVITIGAAGRLHSEFGWPNDLIGLQSKGNWAFDLVAYGRDGEPLVACEVKKTKREIDDLVDAMLRYVPQLPLSEEPRRPRLRNAYGKVVGLRQLNPRCFWALGPNNYGKIFRFVAHMSGDVAGLEEMDEGALVYRMRDGNR